jgi:hypothetical protein
MSFNADKCFIIAAGTKSIKINYEYKIHNQDLEKVPHSKYLGVKKVTAEGLFLEAGMILRCPKELVVKK